MSQTYTDDCFAGGHVAQTDMGNIENNCAALKSSFSGSSAPSNPVPGMPWFDTANEIMRFRDPDDAEWLAFMPCDDGDEGAGAKGYIWLYRNNTVDGMVIDTTVSDRVLAVKGGSNAYNANGGTNAGTWTQPNHTHPAGAHTHPTSATGTTGAASTAQNVGTMNVINEGSNKLHTHSVTTTGTAAAGSGNSGDGATASTYRPAAAIGTLQRPDI